MLRSWLRAPAGSIEESEGDALGFLEGVVASANHDEGDTQTATILQRPAGGVGYVNSVTARRVVGCSRKSPGRVWGIAASTKAGLTSSTP